MLALLIAYAAGRADRRRPRVRPSTAESTVAWLIVCALITPASLPIGLALLVPTVVVLASRAYRPAGPPR